MEEAKRMCIFVFLWILVGCYSPYTEFGAGYTRFETDDITSTVSINSKDVKTTIQHVDGFLMKVRGGGGFIEALPQLQGGVEFRTGIGGAVDTKKVDGQTAYSEILLLLLGGGPFLGWKQPLGDKFYVELGGFIGGYTVGVHEKGRSHHGHDHDVEEEAGIGWSGGLYTKIGVMDLTEFPSRFALELSYEGGEWEFEEDIGRITVENISALFSAEVEF